MSTSAAADPVVRSDRRRDLEEEVGVNFGNRKPELERERKLEAVSKKRVIKPSKNNSVIGTLFVIVRLRAKMDKDKEKEKEKVRNKAADSNDSQLKALRIANYENPSPIIANAIPQSGFIGIAETGSGKTAAFVLRMLPCIARLPPGGGDGPYALVVAPTRQRVLQIEEEVVKFAYNLGIKVVSIVGRRYMEEQGLEIRRGCDVVIATPPLLFDCLNRRYAVFKQCKYVVLDEVDRMIDMGFLPRVMDVLLAVMPYAIMSEDREVDDDKRIYMFTATTPPAFQRLARTFLRNPVVRELNYY